MNWKDIAELTGIAAIVASLIFVGLQMKQSQEIAIAAQYQERANTAIEYYSAHMGQPAISDRARRIVEAASKGNPPAAVREMIASQSPESVALAYVRYRTAMTLQDNNFFQYESGFMTMTAWQAQRNRLRLVLTNAVVAAMYRTEKEQWRLEFQQLCDQILAELEADTR